MLTTYRRGNLGWVIDRLYNHELVFTVWMAGRKSLWYVHGGTGTTMQGPRRARAQSVRQTVTAPASGLFGKPCWIAHFVCGIRAGGKAASFADTSATGLPMLWQSTAVWCHSKGVEWNWSGHHGMFRNIIKHFFHSFFYSPKMKTRKNINSDKSGTFNWRIILKHS